MRILLLGAGLLLLGLATQTQAQTKWVHTASMPSGVTKPAPADYLYLGAKR